MFKITKKHLIIFGVIEVISISSTLHHVLTAESCNIFCCVSYIAWFIAHILFIVMCIMYKKSKNNPVHTLIKEVKLWNIKMQR